MKFFVTGRSSNVDEVRRSYDLIEAAGHTVIKRWTELPMIKPYRKHQSESAQYAQDRIAEIACADVYILLPHQNGNGVFTELGAALALASTQNTVRVFAVGDQEAQALAMFHYHPAIEWVESVEEVVDIVGNTKNKSESSS